MKNKDKTILAITKTEGSGARTVATTLARRYGYRHYSIRDYLRKEYRKANQNQPAIHQDQLKTLANKLRAEQGLGTIIEPIFEKILHDNKHSLSIIESLLCPAEIEYLQNNCKKYHIALKLIAIDAPQSMRFARLNQCKDSKGLRSLNKLKETDKVLYLEKRKELFIPVIVEQLIHAEEFERFRSKHKEPHKVNVPLCLSYVGKNAVFQNPDGDLTIVTDQIHQFVVLH